MDDRTDRTGIDAINRMIQQPVDDADDEVDDSDLEEDSENVPDPPGGDIAADRRIIYRGSPTNGAGGRQPWDRILGTGEHMRDGESDRAWEAFRYFRDMGVGRSIGAVQRDFKLGVHGMATRWATKYRWRDRAAAWDAHLDEIAQKAYEDEALTMGRRHARMGMKMQGLGEARIKEYIERPELAESITVRDALAITEAGVKMEREARAIDGQTKGDQKGGNITFNFNFKPPKWAPQSLVIEGKEIREANESEGAESKVDESEAK